MPQVTFYLRKEDIEQWKAIEHKSEFIHRALYLHEDGELVDTPIRLKTEVLRKEVSTFKSAKDVVRKINPEKEKDLKFCKHDFPVGFCKHGCAK